jgi:hypothetical protein
MEKKSQVGEGGSAAAVQEGEQALQKEGGHSLGPELPAIEPESIECRAHPSESGQETTAEPRNERLEQRLAIKSLTGRLLRIEYGSQDRIRTIGRANIVE